MESYTCNTCGYVYDPTAPDAKTGAPGVPFASLPDDWVCPKCGAERTEFEPEDKEPMPGLVAPPGT